MSTRAGHLRHGMVTSTYVGYQVLCFTVYQPHGICKCMYREVFRRRVDLSLDVISILIRKKIRDG